MDGNVWIIQSTVGGEDVAGRLARESVEGGLAACAQVESPMISHYIWRGQLEESREFRITFKTGGGKLQELMTWIRANHPYEVPEILAWPATAVDEAYAKWIDSAQF